jgi:hypothetical protein
MDLADGAGNGSVRKLRIGTIRTLQKQSQVLMRDTANRARFTGIRLLENFGAFPGKESWFDDQRRRRLIFDNNKRVMEFT